MSDLKSRVGRRIRELRTAKGLSQENLAALAGLSTTFVGELERGEKVASIDTIESLATGCGVPISAFFVERSPNSFLSNPPRPDIAERISTLLKRQTHERLVMIEKVVRAMCNEVEKRKRRGKLRTFRKG